MIGRLWERALQESTVLRRSDQMNLSYREIVHALDGRSDANEILEELFSLGSVRRLADGTLVDPGDPRYEDAAA
jgi:DNA-directed RNA polymerase subunit F